MLHTQKEHLTDGCFYPCFCPKVTLTMGLSGAPCMKPQPLRKTWRPCGRSWSHSTWMYTLMFAGLCTKSMAPHASTYRGPFLLICWVSYKKEFWGFKEFILRSQDKNLTSVCILLWNLKDSSTLALLCGSIPHRYSISGCRCVWITVGFIFCFQRRKAWEWVWQFHTVRDWTDSQHWRSRG